MPGIRMVLFSDRNSLIFKSVRSRSVSSFGRSACLYSSMNPGLKRRESESSIGLICFKGLYFLSSGFIEGSFILEILYLARFFKNDAS